MEEFETTPGMGEKPLNQTGAEAEQRTQEELKIAERIMAADYRSSMTIIGSDLITEIQRSVEVGDYEKLKKDIMKASPLAEGLEFGVYSESYGIPETPPDTSTWTEEQGREAQRKENNVYSKMRNLFMTVEDSVDRGNVGYLRDAMLDSLSRPIRELEEWDEDNGASWEQKLRQRLIDSFNRENFNRLIQGEEILQEEEVNKRIQKAINFQKKRQTEKTDGIRQNREDLLALDLHVKGRFTIDNAFRQRQYVAYDRELQSNMKQSVGLGAAEPDGTHWQGFYQVDPEWGEAVDKVERELVKMGYGGVTIVKSDGTVAQTEGIFTANPTTVQFKEMMRRMLEVSRIKGEGKRRMDVVWAAWRLFCFKEMAGKFSRGSDPIDKKDANKGYKITFNANPPYMGDFSTWISWPTLHMASEFGWNWETLEAARNASWNGVLVGERAKPYKAVSHSIHPRGIAHFTETPQPTAKDPMPIERFGKTAAGNLMEFGTLRDDPNIGQRFRGKNLWQIWWEDGLSQADLDFPWVDSDFAGVKAGADEAPSGLVGYWFLQRGRAWSSLKENLGGPELRDLSTRAYVEKLRNYEKLGMIRPGEFMENPAYVKIFCDFSFHKGYSANTLSKIDKGELVSELELTSVDPSEIITSIGIGEKTSAVNLPNALVLAITRGLIDLAEYKYLKQIIKPKG